MRRNAILSVLLIALLEPVKLWAQTTPVINPGDSLRVHVKDAKPGVWAGLLTEVKADHLLVRGLTPPEVPFERITRLDVYQPKGGTNAGKGALAGMVAGFVLLGSIGYFATADQGEYSGVGLVLAAPGGGLGALIGALAGSAQKVPKWRSVPLPTAPLTSGERPILAPKTVADLLPGDSLRVTEVAANRRRWTGVLAEARTNALLLARVEPAEAPAKDSAFSPEPKSKG